MYGIDQNVVLRKFVAQDEMIMDEIVKQLEDDQQHEELESEHGKKIQDLIYNDVKHAQIEELLENGEKNKYSCYSSILESGKYEVKSMLEFSNNILSLECHIFDDLNTTPNFSLSKILSCGI